ncbi:MAG: SpoIIE family protein phosphatase [Deltaproteobacteria bacterium]|nr:SpoIIE family protein phosphatase [Deltaproteobacteria bacterium]MDH3898952.1 SpoIIE family protein phosphatase [Deltaproteobacteria bacterium]MDH3928615.1 SpoIIE family protein phosphatase [Deltaproteobacteria bacterium]
MIRIKSLQQRLMLFLFLPVAVLLIGMGMIGFFYARNSLLTQWREAAVLKLQRAAHEVDMRLSRPLKWLEMYNNTGGEHFDEHTQEWILEQLRQLEGVVRVELDRVDEERDDPMVHMHREQHGAQGSMMSGMMNFHRARIAEITPPRYDTLLQHETVSIISELHDKDGVKLGQLEVVIRFNYLLENLGATGWWQSRRSFLVDNTGKVLVCTDPDRRRLGENNDPLELATLKAIKEQKSGTILGEGHPPSEVSGFYQLEEAPWSVVMVAPGREILAPIVKFRHYYIVGGSLFVLLILLLIRLVTGRTVSSIKDVSSAAANIAQGDYTASLPVRTQDEVGQLIRNFNTMTSQLQERMELKEAMGLAMEVQQSLLPKEAPRIEGFDIAGQSIYCDETGGDYYDFIEFSELGHGRVGVAVGDVAGHGIAPALLMTTVRALLRSRIIQPGSLAQIITDVNRLLCIDTSESGNFMTLFFMLMDSDNREVQWVRAGHEPALVYDPSTDSFSELYGDGIALGVDETWSFQENRQELWSDSQIVLIGTDGIWESENLQGEGFGKKRLREIIRSHKHHTSQEIVHAITKALADHRQTAPQQDDITMVVVKKL